MEFSMQLGLKIAGLIAECGRNSANFDEPSMKKTAASKLPLYKNPSASAARRVKDLLSRMTLEEKAAQMMCIWQEKSIKLQDANGNFDLKKARKHFGHGRGIGQIARPSDAGSKPTDAGVGKSPGGTAELTNAIQKFFIEHSRL